VEGAAAAGEAAGTVKAPSTSTGRCTSACGESALAA
jgi:hypothetical protein